MLVLSRKPDESIMIGGSIEIVVLGVEGDNVKLGIRAPKEIEILRKELYLNVQMVNREAAAAPISLDAITRLLNRSNDGK